MVWLEHNLIASKQKLSWFLLVQKYSRFKCTFSYSKLKID
jgi:hypothetical protein